MRGSSACVSVHALARTRGCVLSAYVGVPVSDCAVRQAIAHTRTHFSLLRTWTDSRSRQGRHDRETRRTNRRKGRHPRWRSRGRGRSYLSVGMIQIHDAWYIYDILCIYPLDGQGYRRRGTGAAGGLRGFVRHLQQLWSPTPKEEHAALNNGKTKRCCRTDVSEGAAERAAARSRRPT